jgi:DNA-binding response OmpR family regulator
MSIAKLSHWFTGNEIKDRAGEPKREVFRQGDFELDQDARMARVRGKALQLSSSEFDLLHFLLTHSKNLVTPHTVLSTGGAGSNAIRRVSFMETLLSLRKRLEAVSDGEQYLKTEPWVLYRFDSMGRRP